MRINVLSKEDVETFARVPLFSELTAGSMAELLASSSVHCFSTDSLLFSAGDPADRLFVVVSGAVRLGILDREGNETIIEVIGSGASFGEGALFASRRYPVQAEALAGTRLVSINGASFIKAMLENKTLAFEMLESLGRWQLRLMAELRQLKLQSPAQRLGLYLLLSVEEAAPDASIQLPYRKSLIARRIGITPESLSRALSRLAHFGVESRGETIVIHDVEALRQFCDA
jgi:CRP-like cAMP-binding protein